MPRERAELIRPGKFREKVKMFVLAYEGNNTEPQYYEALKKKLKYKKYIVHIESLKRRPGDTKSAPNHVFEKLKQSKRDYNFKESDEFWMIIDKDDWVLDKWKRKCIEEKNFFIALSNPTFELWLLLHIVDISGLSDNELKKMYRNPHVNTKKRHLEKLLSVSLPDGYNKSKIKPKRFIEQIEKAIEQAKNLDKKEISTNLGSHNYILVSKLLNE